MTSSKQEEGEKKKKRGRGMPRSSTLAYRAAESASFGFLSPEEARRLSVLEITSEHSFAALGIPERGGVYDPRLGPVDFSSPR
jgi:hypothetical protein